MKGTNPASLKITHIKAQVKNPERVSVFVDGKYAFSLTFDQLLAQKITKDMRVSPEDIVVLKKLSDEGKLRARVLEWLMRRPHSERELRDYLFKKRVEKDFMEQLIAEFKQKNYLDDELFARWFAENRLRKRQSTRVVSYELRTKGVSQDIISRVLSEIVRPSTDEDSLRMLIQKLRSRTRYQDDDKLARYLIGKGFSYETIRRLLSTKQES